VAFPIDNHYGLIVGVFDEQTIVFLAAADLVLGEKLGGEDDIVEDQAEATTLERCSPVKLTSTVEQITAMPSIDFHVGATVLNTQCASGKVSEANSVG
jgi:hypothetical protein